MHNTYKMTTVTTRTMKTRAIVIASKTMVIIESLSLVSLVSFVSCVVFRINSVMRGIYVYIIPEHRTST